MFVSSNQCRELKGSVPLKDQRHICRLVRVDEGLGFCLSPSKFIKFISLLLKLQRFSGTIRQEISFQGTEIELSYQSATKLFVTLDYIIQVNSSLNKEFFVKK